MSTDLKSLLFLSLVNYLKRSTFCDSTVLTAGSFGSSFTTINHVLNKIPFYEVEADLLGDGTIWARNRLYKKMTTASPSDPEITTYIDTGKLVITLKNNATGSISRRVYWLIYLDYD